MKNLFTEKQRWFVRVVVLLSIPVVLFSCLHLRAVYCPEVVKTNETFEVVMVADMRNPLDDAVTERFAYGFVGVMLPVGWTIDAESMSWQYIGLDDDYDYGTQTMNGKCLLDEEMTDYCITQASEDWGDEYYWQGFKTDGRIHSENIDSIVVKFNVTTNDQIGEYLMLIGIQETSYDQEGYEKGVPVPGNTLVDNKPNGPFFRAGSTDSDEFSKMYMNITVEKGSGSGIQYSKPDKETYTVTSLGDGKVRINLENENKIGATSIVYDKNGRQVASQQLTQIENVLDATLQPDVYFIAVQKDGIRSSKKVLVK